MCATALSLGRADILCSPCTHRSTSHCNLCGIFFLYIMRVAGLTISGPVCKLAADYIATMKRLFWIFVSAVIAIAPANFARAFSITAVRLSPGPQISPSDRLQMEVQITTPGQPPSLYAPTQIAVDSNGVHVDIFPNSGALTVIGYLYETIDLGSFPVGTYNYEVIIHPAQEVNWGSR